MFKKNCFDHSLNIYQSSEHLLVSVQVISLYRNWGICVLVFNFFKFLLYFKYKSLSEI